MRRAAESAAVAKLLGIRYDVWDIDDCTLVADLETRRKMIRYIREFSPDLVISHRQNDYHADHRAVGQLVQDASYMLIVPHECEDVPAMRKMPVIMYFEDHFTSPQPFRADVVVDISDVADKKVGVLDMSPSQMYEWLPYSYEETAPEDPEARRQWLWRGYRPDLTDEEILQLSPNVHGLRSMKTAVRFRKELIARYGQEKGNNVRFAEAFEVCEYGSPLTAQNAEAFFSF